MTFTLDMELGVLTAWNGGKVCKGVTRPEIGVA